MKSRGTGGMGTKPHDNGKDKKERTSDGKSSKRVDAGKDPKAADLADRVKK